MSSSDRRFAFQPLERKIEKSLLVISEAQQRYGLEHIGLTWTGGKDSTVLLSLMRGAHDGVIPVKVFTVEPPAPSRELDEFRDRVAKDWSITLISLRYEETGEGADAAKDPVERCYRAFKKILGKAVGQYGIRGLLAGVRWDEHSLRAEEEYFSERTNYIQINPLLHFMERDIWSCIKEGNIPYCELYDKGFKNLCDAGVFASAATAPERAEEAEDKEKIMENLRQLGYF